MELKVSDDCYENINMPSRIVVINVGENHLSQNAKACFLGYKKP